MKTLEDILANPRLSPGDVLILKAHTQRIIPEILDKYIEIIPKQEDIHPYVEQVFLVNSYLGELERRNDTENMKEIQNLLQEGENLSTIITQTALILSDALPKKEYKRQKKKAFSTLTKEIRKRQKAVIQSRMLPYRAFSSEQYYGRLAIFGTFIATAGFAHAYFKNINDAPLIESAKLHQNKENFSSVREELKNPEKEKQFYAWRIADRNFENRDLSAQVELAEICSREIYSQLQTDEVKLFNMASIKTLPQEKMNPNVIAQKIHSLEEFIKFYKGDFIAVKAKFKLADLLQEGKKIPYYITRITLSRVYDNIYKAVFQETGDAFLANRETEAWLTDVSTHTDTTAVDAASLLGDLNGAYSALGKDYYEKVARDTTIPEQYADANFAILLGEKKTEFRRGKRIPVDFEETIERYKAVAGYTENEKQRNAMLLSTAAMYSTMKQYAKANTYCDFIVETSKEDHTGVHKAQELKTNPHWFLFWDMVHNK